jgi:hypothetical protein
MSANRNQPPPGAATNPGDRASRELGGQEDLIPLAVVIAAGCVPCAERQVARALAQGRTKDEIKKTLGILAYMTRAPCFKDAIGVERISSMRGPLEAAGRALKRA